jgi:hypothetical protein
MKLISPIIGLFPYVLCTQIDPSQAYMNGVNYVSTNMKIEQKHLAQEIMSNFYLRHTNCCERHYMVFTNAQ